MFIQERSHYGLGGFKVWSGISIDDNTILPIIRNDNLMTQSHVDEMLRFQMVPYSEFIRDSFLLICRIIPDVKQLVLRRNLLR
ncbi:hypothetical protein TNCV_4567241 [Trichonephila clavipes]|nr:hypothetical protein TNCV_4567241 [Trichonephila clavipes]